MRTAKHMRYNITMSAMKKLSDIAPLSEKHHSEKKQHHGKEAATNNKLPRSSNDKTHIWTKRKTIIIAGASLLVLAIAAILIMLFSSHSNFTGGTVKNPDTANKTNVKYYSPLTGREVADEASTKHPVLAVMIENSPDARPQSGLKDAGVVFEAVAEGGITRFIALYQDTEPSLIGPVRSVRPYYLEWAAAFSPAIAHVGGSPQALTMIRSGNYGVDLDQFANGSSYWRAKDRKAPHNVYTDYSNLTKLASAKGKSSSEFTGLARQSTTGTSETATTSATSINLAVSTGQFAVSYKYDATSHTYLRYLGGVAHMDREKGQIAPNVVIAIHVNQTLQSDRTHNTITTTGSGECYIFQNGTVIKGTWHKDAATAQLKFLDESNQEIELARGQTWITAVQNGRSITWQ